MDFFSTTFLVFFLVVFFLYYLLNQRHQPIIIFIASTVFIASLSPELLIHAFLFVLISYSISYFLVKYKENLTLKKVVYNTGIFLIIGNLVFFKYINFLIISLLQFLSVFKLQIELSTLNIVAPIGISYYTFQGIGYLIQINRGNEVFEKRLIPYFNYFIFFPKFLAGPIEQSKRFIPQVITKYNFDYEDVVSGFRLILWGAFKKLIIADRLAIIINSVYPNIEGISGSIFIITFLLQPLHLYCDFSGYTDIALGIGRIFGFKLTDNFHRPFFSASVTEFWQRWHISLSAWCNEFIFKRVTFKRRKWGKWAPVYSVFLTFLVIGIWHGQRWNFILLGVLQGIAINYEFFTKRTRIRISKKLPNNIDKYLSYIVVYLFFCFTLIFFNATEVGDVFLFAKKIFDFKSSTGITSLLSNIDILVIIVSLLIVFVVEFRQEIFNKDFFMEINELKRWKRWCLYVIFIVIIIYFGSTTKNFVYSQF